MAEFHIDTFAHGFCVTTEIARGDDVGGTEVFTTTAKQLHEELDKWLQAVTGVKHPI
jgi:hypothetical protein